MLVTSYAVQVLIITKQFTVTLFLPWPEITNLKSKHES